MRQSRFLGLLAATLGSSILAGCATTGREFVRIPLQHASATELRPLVVELFVDTELDIAVDPRENVLWVRNGTAEIEDFRDVVNSLDVPPETESSVIRLINVVPEDLKRELREFLEAERAASSSQTPSQPVRRRVVPRVTREGDATLRVEGPRFDVEQIRGWAAKKGVGVRADERLPGRR